MRKRLFALTLSVLLGLGASVHAAPPPAAKKVTGGITISPAFQELVLAERQKALVGTFLVANNSDTPETFEISTVDMGTLEDTGGVVLSGLPADYQQKYGLAKWITLSQSAVTIAPRSKSTVSFSVNNDDTLTPGGHYGALVVRRAGDKATNSSERITLSPQAASLIFLRKVGGERYALNLPRIEANHSLWQLPTQVTLPFQNTGNVHVVPRGIVRVRNTFGKEIARGIINPDSGLILPERSRKMTVELASSERVVWPGRYTIEVDYRFDGKDTFASTGKSFYTANLRVFVALLAGMLGVALLGYRFRRQLRRVFGGVGRAFRKVARMFRRRKASKTP